MSTTEGAPAPAGKRSNNISMPSPGMFVGIAALVIAALYPVLYENCLATGASRSSASSRA